LPLPYALLARVLPGFSAMRAPQRLGVLVTLAAVSLGALGLAHARGWLHRRGFGRVASALPVLVVAAGLLEATPRALRTVGMEVGAHAPPAYQWLAAHGDG